MPISLPVHALPVPALPVPALLPCCCCRLLQNVQQQLTSAEKQDKQDDSPVTVADYGVCGGGASQVLAATWQQLAVCSSRCRSRIVVLALALTAAARDGDAGAQALVAWVLRRADPSAKLSMVAEEDAADLR